MWWLVLAAGTAVLLLKPGKARAAVGKLLDSAKQLPRDERVRLYRPFVASAAARHQIPERVFSTWVSLESDWKANEYNPEPTALARWACEIANGAKWRKNPDYANAAEVCRAVTADPSQVERIASASGRDVPYDRKAWKFGSFGLAQLTAITARTDGFPYERSNRDLFDPETNLEYAGRKIARLRQKIFPGRTELSEAEWSKIRAGYVGGPGIFSKRPEKAEQIAMKFRSRLSATA